MIKKFLLVSTLVGLSVLGMAKSKLDKGMDEFMDNNREEAISLLESSIDDGDDIPECHLVLSMIFSVIEEYDMSFVHLQSFLNTSDNPYPYIQALFFSGDVGIGSGELKPNRLDFMNQILNSADAPETLKVFCASAIGNHYKAINQIGTAKTYYDMIGSIDQWSSVGPFENISGGGFDKDFGVLSKFKETQSFNSKYNAKINWFEINQPRFDKWVDNEYFYKSGNSVIYAQSFVKSNKTQNVQLRFGVSGSVKVWLNDQLVFSEIEERNNQYDAYIVETQLQKGTNRIVFQIGESYADNSNHCLRITDADGKSIDGLTVTAFASSYVKGEAPVKVIASSEVSFFENLVEQENSIFNQLLLTSAYLLHDELYKARRTIKHAMNKAPNSSYLRVQLADIFIREDNSTGLSMLTEWFKQNDLSSPRSIDLAFDDAMETEDYILADSILNAYLDQYGATETYYSKAIILALNSQEHGNAITLINTAYKKYKTSSEFISLRALVYDKVESKPSKALKLLKKYAKTHYDLDIQKSIANLYFEQKSLSGFLAGVAVYESMVDYIPYNMMALHTLADLNYRVGRYRDALNYIDKCIVIAPYDDDYWSLKGKIHQEMSDDDEAREAYQRAIELYPNNYETRDQLRLLNGDESVFELFGERDYYSIFEKSPDKSAYPNANSVILSYHIDRVVYEGGGAEERKTMLVKVFNNAGVDQWKEYNIYSYYYHGTMIEKLEVLKSDGSRLEAESEGGEVVFTNLEPGDGILISYKTRDYYFGELSTNFWDSHPFILNMPTLENSYSLLISPKVKFNWKFSNGGFEPVKTRKGDFDLYVWTKKDAPELKKEDYMSQVVDFEEVLFISTFESWNDISNWYADIAGAKARPDFEVKEKVAELFEGKGELTDKEKVEIIYNFVVKDIRYSMVSFRQSGLIPQKPSTVLNTKVGDCKDVSTLFVAMCKEAGIQDAGLVLVNTRRNGRKDLTLPSISFNHCIARVVIDEEEYFVELTSEHFAFQTYGDNLINSYALKIYSELDSMDTDAFFFNPKNRTENSIYRSSTLSIDNKNLNVGINERKTGNWASGMRYAYMDESDDERRKVFLERITEDHDNVTLGTLTFPELDTLASEYSCSYDFVKKGAVTNIAGLNIFSIPWSNAITNTDLVNDENRQYPVELWKYFNYDVIEETFTITLPSGTTLAERLMNVYIDNEFATYSITYKVKGNTVVATRRFAPKVDFVAVKDFEKLKAFIDLVVENDTKNIAYK